jgi:K+ transporter
MTLSIVSEDYPIFSPLKWLRALLRANQSFGPMRGVWIGLPISLILWAMILLVII